MILHVFLGRRRRGNLQWAFETYHPDARIWVLSLDVVVDPKVGDLSNAAVIQRWVQAIEAGQVLAIIAGPPCETWSAVRWEALEALEGSWKGPKAPRPIRTWEHI